MVTPLALLLQRFAKKLIGTRETRLALHSFTFAKSAMRNKTMKNTNLIHAKNYTCGYRDKVTLDGVQVFLSDLLEGYSKGGKLGAERKREKYPLSDDPKKIKARLYMRERRAKEAGK